VASTLSVWPSSSSTTSPGAWASGARDEVPQALTVAPPSGNSAPSITTRSPSARSWPSTRIGGTIRFCVDSADHQPDVAIWSAVRNDDTNSPSVGNSQITTSTATEM